MDLFTTLFFFAVDKNQTSNHRHIVRTSIITSNRKVLTFINIYIEACPSKKSQPTLLDEGHKGSSLPSGNTNLYIQMRQCQ